MLTSSHQLRVQLDKNVSENSLKMEAEGWGQDSISAGSRIPAAWPSQYIKLAFQEKHIVQFVLTG